MFTRSKIAFTLAAVLGVASVPLSALVPGSSAIVHAQKVPGNHAQDYDGIYAQDRSGPYLAPKPSMRAQPTPAVRPFTWFEKRWFDYQDSE